MRTRQALTLRRWISWPLNLAFASYFCVLGELRNLVSKPWVVIVGLWRRLNRSCATPVLQPARDPEMCGSQNDSGRMAATPIYDSVITSAEELIPTKPLDFTMKMAVGVNTKNRPSRTTGPLCREEWSFHGQPDVS
ncbi:hypothetical protein A6X21_07620 [Planctopirus hydrillae]|uniref:Uncharacterized protein n=1 Tax=Planctopirus hydrillae TaxID=1841610 RepID=A0A1C3E9A4_9PLAN|nr:hypothetical protein A6X21_07620 [Planctopirus hydrillae]